MFYLNVALRQHCVILSRGHGPGKVFKMKSEIRALEYAVTSLMVKLDLLLTQELGIKTLSIGRGLHISTPDHLSVHEDAFVTIDPIGWLKDSHINARFLRRPHGWELFEGGEIRAGDMFYPFGIVHFKPTEEGLGIRIEAVGNQSWYLEKNYKRLITSLQKDREKHM